MNCCDEYGECRQSDDCPIRTGVILPHQAACAARMKAKQQVGDEGQPLTKAEYEELLWLLLFACFLVSLLLFVGWHFVDALVFMWKLFA